MYYRDSNSGSSDEKTDGVRNKSPLHGYAYNQRSGSPMPSNNNNQRNDEPSVWVDFDQSGSSVSSAYTGPDAPYQHDRMKQDNQLMSYSVDPNDNDDIMQMYGKPLISSFNGNSSGPGSQTHHISCSQLRNPRDYKFGSAKAYKAPLFGDTRSFPLLAIGNKYDNATAHSEEEKSMFMTPSELEIDAYPSPKSQVSTDATSDDDNDIRMTRCSAPLVGNNYESVNASKTIDVAQDEEFVTPPRRAMVRSIGMRSPLHLFNPRVPPPPMRSPPRRPNNVCLNIFLDEKASDHSGTDEQESYHSSEDEVNYGTWLVHPSMPVFESSDDDENQRDDEVNHISINIVDYDDEEIIVENENSFASNVLSMLIYVFNLMAPSLPQNPTLMNCIGQLMVKIVLPLVFVQCCDIEFRSWKLANHVLVDQNDMDHQETLTAGDPMHAQFELGFVYFFPLLFVIGVTSHLAMFGDKTVKLFKENPLRIRNAQLLNA